MDRCRGSSSRRAARSGRPSGATSRLALVAEAHALDLKVLPWTVNEPSDMAALIDAGADGLITDYPDRARTVMSAKGIPLP